MKPVNRKYTIKNVDGLGTSCTCSFLASTHEFDATSNEICSHFPHSPILLIQCFHNSLQNIDIFHCSEIHLIQMAKIEL